MFLRGTGQFSLQNCLELFDLHAPGVEELQGKGLHRRTSGHDNSRVSG